MYCLCCQEAFSQALLTLSCFSFNPITFQCPLWVQVGQFFCFLLAVVLRMFRGTPVLPQLSLYTDACKSCCHKIPKSPLPQSLDSTKYSFWLKGSYMPSRALFQNPKRCGMCFIFTFISKWGFIGPILSHCFSVHTGIMPLIKTCY